ncbi:hypothetical protein L2E82_39269 [Cichorium intybus]|uniref:Uncharacterized protein n=1 Tax=Cichorium intybus TaxID=13427 RepID=A0ACB9AH11_CICIN|nr:hypothetical protein L2E82_39269 [Cichorium intybus]
MVKAGVDDGACVVAVAERSGDVRHEVRLWVIASRVKETEEMGSLRTIEGEETKLGCGLLDYSSQEPTRRNRFSDRQYFGWKTPVKHLRCLSLDLPRHSSTQI